MRLNVLSDHTYTHETLINALDQRLRLVNVPLAARHVSRPSRLIKSIGSHVVRAGSVILRSFLLHRPMQVYGTLGALLLIAGAIPFVRFAVLLTMGGGNGHIQSLVAGSVLAFMGGQILIVGMLATAISWDRRLLEDVLFRMKSEPQHAARERPRLRTVHTPHGNIDDEGREAYERRAA